ncbi:MAG: (d)CMP kinase [Oscillospiraceae bacterium]|jgi:cytidylate kinase|nr:(d)CMP kinase [Oscillospiraceae bacterium]
MPLNIAIDGPAGAGKSTLAKAAAKELGCIYVDTGALYRAVGLFALRRGADPGDAAAVLPLLPLIEISLQFAENGQRVFLNGEDVSEAIRTPEASDASSKVSSHPAVRSFLLDLQRDLAAKNNVVMDGRDIGTVILPNAQVKIFLTASPEERARRRWRELVEKDTTARFEDVLAAILERDARDSSRAAAPLKPAPDSILLDTTGLDFSQSLEGLLKIAGKAAK